MRYLSQSFISTYRGNVLPLMLVGGKEEFNLDKITWHTDNKNIVQITSFDKDFIYGGEFTNGVLLTFLNVGSASVYAEYDNNTYICKIDVREMHHTDSTEDLLYFVGDMHDHTFNSHKLDEFSSRDASFYPKNYYVKEISRDGKMDFGVISDHCSCLNARDFFRGFVEGDERNNQMIFFAGSESAVSIFEKDRYGVKRLHGGEILLFNADNVAGCSGWNDFFKLLKRSPFAFCGYPHPQVICFSSKGIGDFRHRENNSSRFINLFKFVEMGNGGSRSSNVINEYIYSVALDEGFHVSPTCSSDGHRPQKWGYDNFPGKTVIMAADKSKEALHDAILSNRMYATSSGNVKLFYSVNGKIAPATLENEGEYHFCVKLEYFRSGEPDTQIKICKVITDKGNEILELQNMGDYFSFTLSAPDSHYFYLCLLDEKGRKTWSCPVWTGKPFEKKKGKKLTPISKDKIKVFDRVSGAEASQLINDNSTDLWESDKGNADLIFDLEEEKEVCALSHYPFFVDRADGIERDKEYEVLKKFPSKYRISVSCDGNSFTPVSKGFFRVFGWEETVRFAKTKARYVRLEILSTVGKEWAREETADATLCIAEITLWN